jgi:hypothetical protein
MYLRIFAYKFISKLHQLDEIASKKTRSLDEILCNAYKIRCEKVLGRVIKGQVNRSHGVRAFVI